MYIRPGDQSTRKFQVNIEQERYPGINHYSTHTFIYISKDTCYAQETKITTEVLTLSKTQFISLPLHRFQWSSINKEQSSMKNEFFNSRKKVKIAKLNMSVF